MTFFNGFPGGQVHLTPVPGSFFSELLPQIDHLGELKLTLYVFWRLDRLEGAFRYLRVSDFIQDERFMGGLSSSPEGARDALGEALGRAVSRGTLLSIRLDREGDQEHFYFLNSPKGRAAIQAIESGDWQPVEDKQIPADLQEKPSNIFQLYEENIGPLTPMIAESLGEAEDTYPIHWIEDAIRIAVEKNKRNWRYAAAILERWRREGRDDRKERLEDRRDSEETRRQYFEGKYSDFIER
jgi:DnaD/phage-associated family protein